MLQEAADEFVALKLHHLALVIISIILVAEAYMLVIAVDNAVIVDGDLVGVEGEVGDKGFSPRRAQ